VLPDGGVDNTDVLVVITGLLQGRYAVPPIVLQVSQVRLHRVRGADPAQACQREVVMENEGLLGVVETLDVLARLGVVGTSVDVTHHVHVGRDARQQ